MYLCVLMRCYQSSLVLPFSTVWFQVLFIMLTVPVVVSIVFFIALTVPVVLSIVFFIMFTLAVVLSIMLLLQFALRKTVCHCG